MPQVNSVVFTSCTCLESPDMINFFRETRKYNEKKLGLLWVVVIPKSSTTEQMVENINVFEFELSTQLTTELNNLDQGNNGRKFGLAPKSSAGHPVDPTGLSNSAVRAVTGVVYTGGQTLRMTHPSQ
ncbi:hypothetical protein J6590_092415 [Homalodisca vitripennis]|nr:hypothetical protein J6590_080658 [Homalodisca vitripennis]KAG8329185.1 hypothetical protein J6590_092415 [Homalodisca vitripennis]